MIGNAMLGEYEQYSHAPSSKLVYNLHTLVFLGIVRRQGSCKTLRSKHHQTLSFHGTFPVKTFLCIRRIHYPGADVEVQLCQSQGFITSLHRVLQPQRQAGSTRCVHMPAASSAGNEF